VPAAAVRLWRGSVTDLYWA